MQRRLLPVWVVGCGLIALAAASSAQAQVSDRVSTWQPEGFVMAIVSTLVFAFIGIFVAIIGFKLFDLLIHFNLEQEICEKQNMAVAVLSGAMVLGICLIVAATVL